MLLAIPSARHGMGAGLELLWVPGRFPAAAVGPGNVRPSHGGIDLPFSCLQRGEPGAVLLIIYTMSRGRVLTHRRSLPLALDFSRRLHDARNKTDHLSAARSRSR